MRSRRCSRAGWVRPCPACRRESGTSGWGLWQRHSGSPWTSPARPGSVGASPGSRPTWRRSWARRWWRRATTFFCASALGWRGTRASSTSPGWVTLSGSAEGRRRPRKLCLEGSDGVEDILEAALGVDIERVGDLLRVLEALGGAGIAGRVLQVLPHHDRGHRNQLDAGAEKPHRQEVEPEAQEERGQYPLGRVDAHLVQAGGAEGG